MSTAFADNLDIEFVYIAILKADVYLVFCYIFLAHGEGRRSEVADDLELIFRLADYSTEGYSYRESNHASTRNAYAHSIFQHICRKHHGDFLWSTSKDFSSLGGAKCNRHRLCTSYSWHYLFINKR